MIEALTIKLPTVGRSNKKLIHYGLYLTIIGIFTMGSHHSIKEVIHVIP
jgi:hypothetical protein